MMRYAAVVKLLGLLTMLFSFSMVPPIVVALNYHEGSVLSFLSSFCITLIFGALLWLPVCRSKSDLKVRDGFLVVVLFWTVLSFFGALPFYMSLFPKITFTNAFFESASGLTTTGATILTGVDHLQRALLYYRQQLQFLGGMGIIVLALAVMPMLGMGGMQLYRAEVVGPFKNSKLTPRIAQTAKALWYIYVGLAVLCILCFWMAGMNLFNAVGEGFATVATGGFAMHDAGFTYYHSTVIDVIAMLFMLASAVNYSVHFNFIWNRKFSSYYRDPEIRAYFKLILLSVIVTTVILYAYHVHAKHQDHILLHAFFTVISMVTTTGATITNFAAWPTFLPFWIICLAIIGGCGGSTAGGIKIARCLLLKDQGRREMHKLIHPARIMTIKLGSSKAAVDEDVVLSIWGFFALYIVLFVVLLLLLLAAGMRPESAFGALVACISNTGTSLSLVPHSFMMINNFSKWVLIFAMFAGRLEIFTLLVLFMPSFWRR